MRRTWQGYLFLALYFATYVGLVYWLCGGIPAVDVGAP